MTDKELLERFIKTFKRREELLDKFQELFGFTGGVFTYDVLSELEDLNLELTMQLLNDKEKWLEWYVLENNCGKRELPATFNGQIKKIITVEDLLELIKTSRD